MNLHPIFFFSPSHQISSRSCLHQILSAARFCNIIQFGILHSAPVPQTRSSVYWITTRSWNKRKMKTWELSMKCKEKPLISKWYHPSRLRTGYGQRFFFLKTFSVCVYLYVCVCWKAGIAFLWMLWKISGPSLLSIVHFLFGNMGFMNIWLDWLKTSVWHDAMCYKCLRSNAEQGGKAVE